MFGEYCLCVAGKPVALVCDEQLFLKPTDPARALISTVVESAPYPAAKSHLLITADLREDRDWLSKLVEVTANELPMPQPKMKKKV